MQLYSSLEKSQTPVLSVFHLTNKPPNILHLMLYSISALHDIQSCRIALLVCTCCCCQQTLHCLALMDILFWNADNAIQRRNCVNGVVIGRYSNLLFGGVIIIFCCGGSSKIVSKLGDCWITHLQHNSVVHYKCARNKIIPCWRNLFNPFYKLGH